MQLQAAGGAAGLPGLPPGFPSGMASGMPSGLPPGLGIPTSTASFLAGLPQSSSSAAFAAHMMGARLPGPLPTPHEMYEKEKELHKSMSALPGPMSGHSDDRNVSTAQLNTTDHTFNIPTMLCFSTQTTELSDKNFVNTFQFLLQRTSLSPSHERAKSPRERRSPLPEAKKMKKEEVLL